MALLDAEQVQDALRSLDGWSGGTGAITRKVDLGSFPQAIETVDRIAVVAEAIDHHPDIDIRWRTLTFTLSTHSEGGVTQKDIDLAELIDAILNFETAGDSDGPATPI
ncbi:MAG TPA: 4a-hydroxytetrahydrobiopterin dehydratase [Micromonosporaceae bacterium]|nr:4a-hydroxytetrahydrobiopterin dehydratase [Micromonosporaceae bacterium]